MVERRVLMFQAKQRTGAQIECLSSGKIWQKYSEAKIFPLKYYVKPILSFDWPASQ